MYSWRKGVCSIISPKFPLCSAPEYLIGHSLTAWVWILYLSQWGTGFYPREWILLWETNSLPNGYPVKSFIPPFTNVYLISYTTGWHYKMFDILSDFSPIKIFKNTFRHISYRDKTINIHKTMGYVCTKIYCEGKGRLLLIPGLKWQILKPSIFLNSQWHHC